MGNNPFRYSDMLGDTVRGVDAQSAQRTQGIIVSTFAKKIAGGMGFASLIKLGKDGKTFQSIGRGDFNKATKGLSKDAKALATGYFNAINDKKGHTVDIIKRSEKVSEESKFKFTFTEAQSIKNGADFDTKTGGGINHMKGNEYDTYSTIVMDSKNDVGSDAGELLAHELLGHGGNYKTGIGTPENGANAIQATNVYRRAIGNTNERGLEAGHQGIPGQSQSAFPPNMSIPMSFSDY
jgi:hypothetical protein